jgi:predicted metal-binding membrane protein
MAVRNSYPLPGARAAILSLLLVLAAGAWVLLVWQATHSMGGMGLTMGLGAPLFVAIWVVMMVATMFPAAAPMILMFARVHAGKRQQGQPFVPTWVFVGAYLLVWTLFGALAYAAAAGTDRLAAQSMWLMENGARLGGVLLVVAGLYQVSPLKQACLSRCRTPLQFIMTSWREGYGGAVRMGLEHGAYCLGCCWLLFVILFPLGMMNVAAIAAITLLIFAEKALPLGRWTSRTAAAALIVYGIVVIAWPHALPTTM